MAGKAWKTNHIGFPGRENMRKLIRKLSGKSIRKPIRKHLEIRAPCSGHRAPRSVGCAP